MRQYKRIRGEKNKKFSYKDIKTVYTIVLFEKSSKEFHAFPGCYCHYFEQVSDSGLRLELLQKYVFVPLDIFKKSKHNKDVTDITDQLDAWLMFFSTDDPEDIIRLVELHPMFKSLYDTAYNICRNMERIMGIFSEELLELDRNTVQYMIDEMQNTIDQQTKTIEQKSEKIERQQARLEKERALRIKQIRNLFIRDVSPEEIADILAIDLDWVKIIYTEFQKNPRLDISDILERFKNQNLIEL